MFKRFREKIERALEKKEAERPLTRDEVDQLLSGMRDELIEFRARIPKLDKEAQRLSKRAQQQIQRAELAHNKAREAQAAGNLDEAQMATEAARQALQDVEELRSQSDEMRGEAERLKVEYDEKMEQLKYAERNRSALVARSRRVTTGRKLDEMLRGPESGLRRFERVEEDIDTAEDLAAASREVEEALGGRPSIRELETDVELRKLEAAKEADEIDKRLADLKRQMEEEGD
jgi:phage shock protein A